MIIFLKNLVCCSRQICTSHDHNLRKQSAVIIELNGDNPKRAIPFFSLTFSYFCLNFWSFYCHVILPMYMKFSYFLDFFCALESPLLLYFFQIPFVHNFLENKYFPLIFGTRLLLTYVYHRYKYLIIWTKTFWEKTT